MKCMKLSLLLLFFILSFPVYSQQIYIDLRFVNLLPENKSPAARIFYIGDIDPTGLGNAPYYYTLKIGGNRGPAPLDVRIIFRVVTNGQIIVEGESNVFQLFPGDYSFNNNQLNLGTAFIENPENRIKIRNYSIDLNRIDKLEAQVSSTGKLPAGVYQFQVELVTDPPSGAPITDQNPDDNTLTITNPTTIEPLFPGSRVSLGDAPEIPTTVPYFVWQSDADLFDLYVYWKYESESIEDVLSRDPILHLENYSNLVFQYPASTEPLLFLNKIGYPPGGSVGAVRLIEPGYTYYWYVNVHIPTASGETLLPSDVYQFKVVDRENTSASSDLIMTYLRQILGDQYDQYMDALQGYTPTGVILMNGTSVEVDVLAGLLQKLLSQTATIQNIIVEN